MDGELLRINSVPGKIMMFILLTMHEEVHDGD